MLPEWYFCCCVESDPEKTKTFLSILETLENPETDSTLFYLTCEELRRCDILMQIYAAPHLLQSLHKKELTGGALSSVENYFQRLVDFIPEEATHEFQKLINCVLNMRSASRDIINSILSCAKTAIRKLPERIASPKPYFDLKEFLPETLLLAIVFDQYHHNANFASRLSSASRKEDDSVFLMQLIQNALDNKLGRMGFRLAVHLAQLTTPENIKNDLLETIRNEPNFVVELEPDLLSTYAELLFLSHSNISGIRIDSDIVKKMAEESVLFKQLRGLLARAGEKKALVRSSLQRIGIESMAKRPQKVLPVIYWQLTIWEIISRIDPNAAADVLSCYWTAPEEKFAPNIQVSSPLNKKDSNEWKFQLISLMYGRQFKKIPYLQVTSGKDLYFPPEAQWIFFSPWLQHKKKVNHLKKQWSLTSYPGALNPGAIIRLCACSVIAVRILQELPEDSRHRMYIASFIAHASDVIDSVYGYWLKNYNNDEKKSNSPSLVFPSTGLTMFAQRQISLAGKGHFDSISPECFLDILRDKKNAHETPASHSEHKIYLLDRILPEVLISWISDAYPGALGQKAGGRWFQLIPEVYEYHLKGDHSYRKQIDAAIVARFLCPDYRFQVHKTLDWRYATDKKGDVEWRVSTRQLLLTEPSLTPDDWLQDDWHEPDEWNNKIYYRSTRLVRAIERLSSLTRFEREGEEIPSRYKQWRTVWRDYLNDIGKKNELDRFIRLRLVELIDDPVLKNWPHDQELIMLVLLEYGCFYDLKKMIDSIFGLNQSEKGAPINEARKQVQKSLLITISKELVQYGNLHGTDSLHRNPSDPRLTLISFQRMILFRNELSRLAHLHRFDKKEKEASDLISTLRKHRGKFYEEQTETAVRKLQVDIELHGNRKKILRPCQDDHVRDWSIKGAINDPNGMKATLFFYDLELNGIINLFEASYEESRTFFESRPQKPVSLLAVVVLVEEKDEKLHSVFNCGLSFYFNYYIRHSKGNPKPFRPGDYLSLPISYNQRNKRWEVHEDGTARIQKLKPRSAPGDIGKVLVREYWQDRLSRRRLQIKHGGKSIDHTLDFTQWDVNISRCFRKFPQPRDRKVFTRLSTHTGGAQPTPLNQDLTDLLLNAHIYAEGRAMVLTFIEAQIGPFGERSWKFSVQPGENYILLDNQFIPDDAEFLEKKLLSFDKIEEAAGLIVTVTSAIHEDDLLLRLVREKIEDPGLAIFYPDLRTPFDERNIEWKNLFTESCVAKKVGNNWWVDLDREISGYPRRLQVRWGKHHPRQNSNYVEFYATQWDEENWRTAEVVGNTFYMNEAIPKGSLEEFFDRWNDIKPGALLSLRQPYGNIGNDGCIYCSTNERISIRVEVESLTMTMIRDNSLPAIEGNRLAEVARCWWQDTNIPPSLNIDDIPKVVRENGSGVGLFTKTPGRSGVAEGAICTVVWKVHEKAFFSNLRIGNLSRLNIYPGWKITAEFKDGKWHFSVSKPSIITKALWTFSDPQQKHDRLTYLGSISHGVKVFYIAESEPGMLVKLDAKHTEARHLSTWNGNSFQDGLIRDQRMTNIAKKVTWIERRFEYRLAVLSMRKEVLVGICKANTPDRNLTVDKTRLRLSPCRADRRLFSIRREFDLSWVKEKPFKKERIPADNIEIWRKKLSECLENHKDLDAVYDKEILTIHGFKVQDPESGRWTSEVPLGDGEGPFMRDAQYSPDASVRIFESVNSQIFSSFRLVKPYTPEDFRRLLGANYDTPTPLEYSLYVSYSKTMEQGSDRTSLPA